MIVGQQNALVITIAAQSAANGHIDIMRCLAIALRGAYFWRRRAGGAGCGCRGRGAAGRGAAAGAAAGALCGGGGHAAAGAAGLAARGAAAAGAGHGGHIADGAAAGGAAGAAAHAAAAVLLLFRGDFAASSGGCGDQLVVIGLCKGLAGVFSVFSFWQD